MQPNEADAQLENAKQDNSNIHTQMPENKKTNTGNKQQIIPTTDCTNQPPHPAAFPIE